jgi:hypothetical protein
MNHFAKAIIIFGVFLSTQTFASSFERIVLLNHFRIFTQKTDGGFSLPVPISEAQNLTIEFEIPTDNEPTLKKMYNQVFEMGEFKTLFEVYFFNQNGERYFSQQVTLWKKNEIVVKCTSYFGTDQKKLVPGACAGEKEGALYGVSLFRGLQ